MRNLKIQIPSHYIPFKQISIQSQKKGANWKFEICVWNRVCVQLDKLGNDILQNKFAAVVSENWPLHWLRNHEIRQGRKSGSDWASCYLVAILITHCTDSLQPVTATNLLAKG